MMSALLARWLARVLDATCLTILLGLRFFMRNSLAPIILCISLASKT